MKLTTALSVLKVTRSPAARYHADALSFPSVNRVFGLDTHIYRGPVLTLSLHGLYDWTVTSEHLGFCF